MPVGIRIVVALVAQFNHLSVPVMVLVLPLVICIVASVPIHCDNPTFPRRD